eukprot:944497-Amphidinium_carterae.1
MLMAKSSMRLFCHECHPTLVPPPTVRKYISNVTDVWVWTCVGGVTLRTCEARRSPVRQERTSCRRHMCWAIRDLATGMGNELLLMISAPRLPLVETPNTLSPEGSYSPSEPEAIILHLLCIICFTVSLVGYCYTTT